MNEHALMMKEWREIDTYKILWPIPFIFRIMSEAKKQGWKNYNEFADELNSKWHLSDKYMVDFLERLYASKGFKKTISETALATLAAYQRVYMKRNDP